MIAYNVQEIFSTWHLHLEKHMLSYPTDSMMPVGYIKRRNKTAYQKQFSLVQLHHNTEPHVYLLKWTDIANE